MMFKDLPVFYSDQDPQGSMILIEALDYLQIISERIKKEKEKFLKSSNLILHNLVEEKKLTLDIKSLFIFSKIYLDYLIKYITINFFSKVQGLNDRSFHRHINSLKAIDDCDEKFNLYKKFMSENGVKLLYQICNIRDIITHQKLSIKESILYDPDSSEFHIILEIDKNYSIDSIGNNEIKLVFNPDLDDKIMEFAKTFNVEIEPHDPTKISRFIYLNIVLQLLEEKFQLSDIIKEMRLKKSNKKFENLIQLRKELGLVFNEEGVYEIIFSFTEGLANILKKIAGIERRRF